MRKNNPGFTLVEIMIVVAIIALLAAIAIPNLLRARMTANEIAAQATLKTLSTAEETYAAANNGLYGTIAEMLAAVPPFLNDINIIGDHSGYTIAVRTNTASVYDFTAVPMTFGVTGSTSYAICNSSILRSAAVDTAPACP